MTNANDNDDIEGTDTEQDELPPTTEGQIAAADLIQNVVEMFERPPDTVNHNISESADKIQLSTKIKRGTGTRDQDEIKIKVKGDDPEETAETLHETVVAIGGQGTVNTLRGTQPIGSGGEDDA